MSAILTAIFNAQDRISGQLADMSNQGNAVVNTFKKLAVAAAGVFATKQVIDFGKECFSAATTLESGMGEVFTLLPGITEDAMDDMTAQVREFARETGTLTTDTVPALYSALSAGVPQDNVFEFLESANKLAVGGIAELDDSVAVLSTISNNYSKMGLDAATASDLLFTTVKNGVTTIPELSSALGNVVPAAASANVSFQEVSAAMATMTASLGAGSTSVATTKLRAMFDELTKTGTSVDKTFRQIAGKGFTDFMAQGGNVQDALQMLNDYAVKNNKSIKELFSSVEAGGAALILGSQNADKFAMNMEAMANAAGATDTAYATMQDTVSYKMDLLKAKFEDIKLAIGEKLNKAFSKILDYVLPAVDGAMEAFGQLESFFENFNAEAALEKAFGGKGTGLLKAGKGAGQLYLSGMQKQIQSGDFTGMFKDLADANILIVDSVRTAFGDGFGDAAQLVMGKVSYMATGIAQIMSGELENGSYNIAHAFGLDDSSVDLIYSSIDGIKNGLQSTAAAMWPIFDSVAGAWANIYPIMEDFGNAVFQIVVPLFQTAFSIITDDIIPTVAPIIEGLFTRISEGAQTIRPYIEAFLEKFLEIIPVVQEIASNIAGRFMPILETIGAFINDVFIPKVIGAFEVLAPKVTAAVDSVIKCIQSIWTFLQPVLDVIFEAWNNIFPYMKDIFVTVFDTVVAVVGNVIDIFSGLIDFITGVFSGDWSAAWDGICAAFSGVTDLIGNLFSGVLDYLSAAWEAFKAVFSEAWNVAWTAIKTIFSTLWEGIKGIFQGPIDAISSAWSTFSSWLSGLWSGFWSGLTSGLSGIWNAVTSIFKGPVDAISNVFNTFKSTLSGAWSGLWNGLKNTVSNIMGGLPGIVKAPINAIISGINKFIGGINNIKIPDWVPGVGGKGINIPTIPMLAKGTLDAPETFIAGEKGPELITGAGGSTVYPHSETEKLLSVAERPIEVSVPDMAGAETKSIEEKHITLELQGNGELKVEGKLSKEDILEVMWEYIKPVLMQIIQQEILEEGEAAYEF